MRKNYKSKFNELTPAGWVVVGKMMKSSKLRGYKDSCGPVVFADKRRKEKQKNFKGVKNEEIF